MAYKVFGNPITNSTLEGMPEYAGKTIERIDRAHVALNMKNAQDNDLNAFLEKLKESCFSQVQTYGLVYNATGDTVTFVTSHDWSGEIGVPPYPITIENGQCGVFMHNGTIYKSSAAVVYRGKNKPGTEQCDWMLAWSNPSKVLPHSSDKAYTEIREANHYTGNVWDEISQNLDKSGNWHKDTWNGCFSAVKIDSDKFEAILSLI